MSIIVDNQSGANFHQDLREYCNLQYSRIEKLETQTFNFSNLILTLNTAGITFGFEKLSSTDKIQFFLIPFFLIVSNIIAILYTTKTRRFIKMHQKRAKKARKHYNPTLNEIQKSVKKADSNRDILRRSNLFIILHLFFLTIGILITIYYLCVKCTSS